MQNRGNGISFSLWNAKSYNGLSGIMASPALNFLCAGWSRIDFDIDSRGIILLEFNSLSSLHTHSLISPDTSFGKQV